MAPPIRLRPLHVEDPALGGVAELVRAAFGPQVARFGGQPRTDTAGTLTTRLTHGPGCLAESGARPVGCIFTRMSRDDPDAWYLGNLVVAEAVRGQGLAYRLEGWAEAEARRRGLTRLSLDTWPDPEGPRRLFARWGYGTLHEAPGVVSMGRELAQPRRPGPEDPGLSDTLALIREAFAAMDGQVDPPSSIHRLTRAALAEHARRGELLTIGTPPQAALIASAREDHLYLGKLAVAPRARGRGLARALVTAAERLAADLRLDRLRLQSRIELLDNHTTFAALGFAEIARTAHPGYDRATSLTFERRLR